VLAARGAHLEAVRLLLDAGADPGGPVRQRQDGVADADGARVERPPPRGRAPAPRSRARCSFIEACKLSHLPTVRRMLAKDGALADRVDATGLSPITEAGGAADGAAGTDRERGASTEARALVGAALPARLQRNGCP
jgi:hypothetical protein